MPYRPRTSSYTPIVRKADHLDDLHRNSEVSNEEYAARKRTLDREFRMTARAEAEKLYQERMECWDDPADELEPEYMEEDEE